MNLIRKIKIETKHVWKHKTPHRMWIQLALPKRNNNIDNYTIFYLIIRLLIHFFSAYSTPGVCARAVRCIVVDFGQSQFMEFLRQDKNGSVWLIDGGKSDCLPKSLINDNGVQGDGSSRKKIIHCKRLNIEQVREHGHAWATCYILFYIYPKIYAYTCGGM